ncbi:MAG: ThuA domain-containing protein [Kiritimatiellae bacterium]|nr:ThuA domain-containing protein [Kiritimatiellia bacterium]MDD5519680.1 ThuA domain-containing protein [Kiritimatiellia bacterium]
MKNVKINVTIWNEYIHEKKEPSVRAIYPDGIHGALAKKLAAPDLEIRTATLEEPEHGLTQEILNNTDVLLWWGHAAHEEVKDSIVSRVQQRVWEGMGIIVLHSAHMSKIFRALNGTSGKLHWREAGDRERLWVIDPAHPIAAGLPEHFELPYEEMYGEPFMIAGDAKIVLMSWFEGGELFRSGFTLQRGNGRLFYFRPGHEAFPTYYDPNVLKVLGNAIRWARPTLSMPYPNTHAPDPLEKISEKTFKFDKVGIIKE